VLVVRSLLGQRQHEYGGEQVEASLPGKEGAERGAVGVQRGVTVGEASGQGGEEEGAQERDTGGVSDLVDGGEDPSCGAGTCAGDTGQDDVAQPRGRQAQATDEQGTSEGPVARVGAAAHEPPHDSLG